MLSCTFPLLSTPNTHAHARARTHTHTHTHSLTHTHTHSLSHIHTHTHTHTPRQRPRRSQTEHPPPSQRGNGAEEQKGNWYYSDSLHVGPYIAARGSRLAYGGPCPGHGACTCGMQVAVEMHLLYIVLLSC